jgi:hypothetical protein
VHLLNLTKNAIGGDNIIAANAKEISSMFRMTQPGESFALNKKEFHAVTPLGSADKEAAHRDILLVTFHDAALERAALEKAAMRSKARLFANSSKALATPGATPANDAQTPKLR